MCDDGKRPDKSACVALHQEWAHILNRDVKWKMAYSTVLKEKGIERGMDFPSHEQFQQQIQNALPSKLQDLPFRVDMAPLDPRPTPRIRAAFPCSSMTQGQRGCRPSPWKSSLICYQPGWCNSAFMPSIMTTTQRSRQPAATVLNKTSASIGRTFSVSPSLNQVQQFSQLSSNSPPAST